MRGFFFVRGNNSSSCRYADRQRRAFHLVGKEPYRTTQEPLKNYSRTTGVMSKRDLLAKKQEEQEKLQG